MDSSLKPSFKTLQKLPATPKHKVYQKHSLDIWPQNASVESFEKSQFPQQQNIHSKIMLFLNETFMQKSPNS